MVICLLMITMFMIIGLGALHTRMNYPDPLTRFGTNCMRLGGTISVNKEYTVTTCTIKVKQ